MEVRGAAVVCLGTASTKLSQVWVGESYDATLSKMIVPLIDLIGTPGLAPTLTVNALGALKCFATASVSKMGAARRAAGIEAGAVRAIVPLLRSDNEDIQKSSILTIGYFVGIDNVGEAKDHGVFKALAELLACVYDFFFPRLSGRSDPLCPYCRNQNEEVWELSACAMNYVAMGSPECRKALAEFEVGSKLKELENRPATTKRAKGNARAARKVIAHKGLTVKMLDLVPRLLIDYDPAV